jgi:hypothetical protein
MDAEVQSVRPDAPAGMTYNRKGKLVKKRTLKAKNTKVFVIMQLVDNDGNALTDYGKRNVRVIKTEHNSDKLLELIDNNDYDGAFYLRLDLAAA